MTKTELIELVEDQLGEMRVNQARSHFHPEIIAYTFDKYYRYYLSQAYQGDPYSLDGCTDISYNVPVYADNETGDLFSVIPKQVVPFFPVQGGVMNIWKSSDSTVKFEPYSKKFERRSWNRLGVNYANTVRYWFDRGAAKSDLSASSADNSTFDDYESVVWFKAKSDQLTNSDTVDMDLLITFYAHGDTQDVNVPSNVGGVSNLIDNVTASMLRKLGVSAEGIGQREQNEE